MFTYLLLCVLVGMTSIMLASLAPLLVRSGQSWPESNPEHTIARSTAQYMSDKQLLSVLQASPFHLGESTSNITYKGISVFPHGKTAVHTPQPLRCWVRPKRANLEEVVFEWPGTDDALGFDLSDMGVC